MAEVLIYCLFKAIVEGCHLHPLEGKSVGAPRGEDRGGRIADIGCYVGNLAIYLVRGGRGAAERGESWDASPDM